MFECTKVQRFECDHLKFDYSIIQLVRHKIIFENFQHESVAPSGVRVYTRFMQGVLTDTATKFHTSSIVIDWSGDRLAQKNDANSLVQWVRSCPEKENVHVILSRVHLNGQRSVQRVLQSLGCRVTRR